MGDVTRILTAIGSGDTQAAEELLPLVYDELRRLADHRMARERPGQTLQPTALVHEAYMRLVDVEARQRWDSRGHFFAAAAEAMRRILIERARRKGTVRHGGGFRRVELGPIDGAVSASIEELLAVEEALDALTAVDAKAAELVKLRYFAGLNMAQAAEAMGLSLRTAERNWTYARTWLHRHMRAEEEA